MGKEITNPEVPLLDLKAQYAQIESEVTEAILEVCATQRFVLGPTVSGFEEEIASYCGARYAIGMSSGSDALLVALMAIGTQPGDIVITTPYTFFATGGAISRLGARALYCDIDPLTFNLSPESVRATIKDECDRRDGGLYSVRHGGRVTALLPVHLYGQMTDMAPFLDIAREYGLRIIEDAAQAIGAEDASGCRAGSLGDIGCFSFFPSKNLGAFGDAGLCTTNDPVLAEKLRVLRVHGGSPKYYHSVIGGNFRLDALQAAVLRVKLRYLDGWSAARQANARYYDEAFEAASVGEALRPPPSIAGYRHIYNQYVVRVRDRDALRQYLSEAGIGTEIYYPVPLHVQKCFAYLGYAGEDCPEAMRAASESLALPVYPELTEAQKRHVVATIRSFYS